MPPSQTSCQIPAAVKQASGEMLFGNLNAFGPEVDFAYPPKPAGKAVWNIDWTAKARFRSHSSLLIGAEIGRATSELQSLMRISYAAFCLKKKKTLKATYQI